jgi:hypothetical protein
MMNRRASGIALRILRRKAETCMSMARLRSLPVLSVSA